jgi:hypothetical protein
LGVGEGIAGFSLSLTLAVGLFLSFSGISTFPFWSGAGIRRRTTSARPSTPLRLALLATTEELDPLMRDRETGAGLDAF